MRKASQYLLRKVMRQSQYNKRIAPNKKGEYKRNPKHKGKAYDKHR